MDNGRGHSLIVDLPSDRGGANTAPTAIELAAMSLSGCVMTIFKEVAVKRKFDFKALKVDLEAEKPKETSTITKVTSTITKVTSTITKVTSTITKVTGNVEITTSAEEQDARTVFRLALDICPVGELFVKAGIKPEWQVTVKR